MGGEVLMFRSTVIQKLLMTILLFHIIVSFCHAILVKDSSITYICMAVYVALLVIGQYKIREHMRNFLLHVLIHLIIMIPSLCFFAFSQIDGVIMVITATITTIMSFKKSIDKKKEAPVDEETLSPAAILLFIFFSNTFEEIEYGEFG